MTSRRGFTVLELLIALVLTAVAVTMAGSVLRTASFARERTAQHRERHERLAQVRALLTDMLRHAPVAESVNEPLMQLTTDADGVPRFVFLSNGVRAPFGTGTTWRVSVSVRDSILLLDAEPIGTAQGERAVRAQVAGVSAMRVEFLEHGGALTRAQWRDSWPLPQSRPEAVALHLPSADSIPLVVSLDPLLLTVSGR